MLDACVLYPAPLRDVLVSIAAAHLYRAQWTTQIHDEWIESLINKLELPDKNDRHVLAAAIYSKSDAIITFNQKDFPSHYLQNFDIDILHPDEFISELYDRSTIQFCECISRLRTRLRNPVIGASECLEILEKQGLVSTVKKLRCNIDII